MADFDFTQLKGRMAQAGKGGHVELSDLERNALITNAMDGGSVDPEEVQELIDESLEGYYNKFEVDSELNTKSDKSDTYTKSEVNALIPSVDNDIIIGALPSSGVPNTIYRVPGTNSYTDYAWDGTQFVELGTFTGNPIPDATPTANSTNPVQSGGVYPIANKVDGMAEIMGYTQGTENLFSPTMQKAGIIVSAGKVANSATAQSYLFEVTPNSTITIDHKTTGNRFAIWSFTSSPQIGDTATQTVSNNSANTLAITLGASEHYILVFVNTGGDVDVSGLRVYYGTEFITESSAENMVTKGEIPEFSQQNISVCPLKIFDSLTDQTEQGYVAMNGGTSTNENYLHSDYIEVKPNHKYRLTIDGFICAYNSAKQVISDGGYQGGGALTDYDYTTPSNCAYVIVSARCAGTYISNAGYFKFYDLEPTYFIPSDFLHWKPMNGKKIVVFGDSIAGNYRAGWPLMLQEKTGAFVYNCGFGGCRMELLNGQDEAGTNPFAMCSLVDAIVSGDWSAQEASALYSSSEYVRASLALLKTIDFSQVDVIMIAYGTNEPGYPQDDEQNPTSKYTYAGATRYSLNTMMAQYKQLGVCLLTPVYRYSFSGSTEDSDTYTHPIYGGKFTDNIATLKSVAQEYKVPCIDMYYQLGINSINREVYYYDGTHLNYAGLQRYSGFVAQGITRYQ